MLRTSFNENWYVTKETGTTVEALAGPVVTPYDAMLRETRDPDTPAGMNTGFYPGGVYRYTKRFDAPREWAGGTATLEFEGVYHRSTVFLNGIPVGGRPLGYTTFHVPLDDHLDYGAENVLEVVVDTTDQPNTRWYTGSGIYRPVHLLVGGPVRIAPFGARFTTTGIGGGSATVTVAVDLVNSGADAREVTVEATLVGSTGAHTQLRPKRVTVPSGGTTVTVDGAVADAALWSPDSPELYAARVTVSAEEVLLDEATATIGLRAITVDAAHGLQINGTTYKLRGACIHHDNGVIGATELDAAADRRVRILKDAGYNAIRSAHNPISSALLRACDRHGVMVMDELSDAWYFPKQNFDYGLDFEQWWERDLTAMVEKDQNHPSVVMYSIGNEIAETSQPKGIALNKAMADLCRRLDPSVPVTNGINLFLNMIASDDTKKGEQVRKARESGNNASANMIVVLNFTMSLLERVLPLMVKMKRADARSRDAFADLDVAGYNYAAGRYRLDAEVHPQRVIVGSETNAPDIATNWKLVEELPSVIGDFQWTGWDYIGEAGISTKRYNEPRRLFLPFPALLAGTPVVDITGHQQTQAFVNQIVFGLRTGPVLAVQPVNHSGEKQSKTGWRSTNSIQSWSWEGCEGLKAVVEVYANAARVQLVLNGRPVGSHTLTAKDQFLATFQVPYESGELVAVAYDGDGREIGRDTLTSAGRDLRLAVAAEETDLLADGADLAHLTIAFTDAGGTVRPLTDREVTVTVEGAGELLGAGSANPITTDAFRAGRFTTYNGRGLAVVRSGLDQGEVTVTVQALGVDLVTVTLPVRARTLEATVGALR